MGEGGRGGVNTYLYTAIIHNANNANPVSENGCTLVLNHISCAMTMNMMPLNCTVSMV